MKKSSFTKKSGFARKGAFSSSLYTPESGANRRSSARKVSSLLKAQITGGKSKISKKFLAGKDVGKVLKLQKVKKDAYKRRKLLNGVQ